MGLQCAPTRSGGCSNSCTRRAASATAVVHSRQTGDAPHFSWAFYLLQEQQVKNSLIPGFVLATRTITFAFFPPPRLPPGYVPLHRPGRPAEAAAPQGGWAPGGDGGCTLEWCTAVGRFDSCPLSKLCVSAQSAVPPHSSSPPPPPPQQQPSLRRRKRTLQPMRSCGKPSTAWRSLWPKTVSSMGIYVETWAALGDCTRLCCLFWTSSTPGPAPIAFVSPFRRHL